MSSVQSVWAPNRDPLRTLTLVVYALQAIGLFVGITFVAALMINYVKRDEARGSWLESHMRWQIRTFWWALLWSALSVVTWIVIVGMVGFFATEVWVVYRVVKGWLYLSDGKPMYPSRAL